VRPARSRRPIAPWWPRSRAWWRRSWSTSRPGRGGSPGATSRASKGSSLAVSFDRARRRALQNGCLHAVRVVLERGERDRAKEEGRRCITRFPAIEPDIHEHPPTIFGLLGEVRGELLAATLGSLRVDSAPRGCTVFLNGGDVGVTPVDVPGLIPGEYRVQVECAGPAPERRRVHRAVSTERRSCSWTRRSTARCTAPTSLS
jgi:hypothetical protein